MDNRESAEVGDQVLTTSWEGLYETREGWRAVPAGRQVPVTWKLLDPGWWAGSDAACCLTADPYPEVSSFNRP